MPLIIPRENERIWVDPGIDERQVRELMQPYPASDMLAYSVSRDINNPRNERNTPSALEEVEYSELKEV